LRQLAITNLLLEGIATAVDICGYPVNIGFLLPGLRVDMKSRRTGIEVCLLEKLSYLLGVAQEAHANRDDDHLAWRQPEWPFARKVLAKNGGEALDTASHRPVDHDGAGAARGQCLFDEQRLLLPILLILILGLLRSRRRRWRSRFRLILMGLHYLCSLVFEREIDRLLEVKLDCSALPRSLCGC